VSERRVQSSTSGFSAWTARTLSLGFFQFHARAFLFGEGGLPSDGLLAATGGAVDVVVIVTAVVSLGYAKSSQEVTSVKSFA
jgi:hypothetical protein